MSIGYTVQDGIAVITFDRPAKLNTLTLQMYQDLGDAFQYAAKDPNVGVCVLTGVGEKSFCAGADLTESIPYLADGHYIDEWDAAHFKHINLYKPVIAAINGICMGGGFEIMLGTDIRIASSTAKFALPEVGLGIVPAGGTLARLARQIPYAYAMELIMSGRKFTPDELLRFGVLNYVVEPEQLMSKAMELAHNFLRLSTTALQTAKEAVLKLRDMPLEQAFDVESMLGYKAFTSEDAREGLESFYEKRTADFPSKKWL